MKNHIIYIVFLIINGPGPGAVAQGLQFEMGRPATAEEISDWDRTLDPSGKEIPDGTGTAAQGEAIYLQACVSCHGVNGENGTASELTGYLRIYPIHTWDRIYRTMPLRAFGATERERELSPDEVYALTAYILYLNGMAARNDVLHNQNLPPVRIPDPEFKR